MTNEEIKARFCRSLKRGEIILRTDEWHDADGWETISETSPMIGQLYSGYPSLRRFEIDKLFDEHAGLIQWVENYQSQTQILTCVYCGHAYPPGTPSHGSPVLTEHIKQCEKHPMKKVFEQRNTLRQAIGEFLGVTGERELIELNSLFHMFAPPSEKQRLTGLINALLETNDRHSNQ